MPTFPDYPISDDYAEHVARGSAEPGIDFMTPYGTPIAAPQSGVVTVVNLSNYGAAGRRVTIAGDGVTWDIIHLSGVDVRAGQWVNEGQIIGASGASGMGQDRYYGPHVHMSYWDSKYLGAPPWNQAKDFAHLVNNTRGNIMGNGDIEFIKDQVGGSHARTTSLRQDVDWLKSQVGGSHARTTSLRQDVDWLKSQVGGSRNRTTSLRQDIDNLTDLVESILKKLK